MKLGVKLITGFLLVAFLVGFVGIFGIASNNTIQKNNKIGREVIELINLLDRSLVQALLLIETRNLDDYRKIKSNVENIRKDFDRVHEKREEFLHSIKGFRAFDENIGTFTRISNGIIAIHKGKLVREREFTQKAILERDLRRKIRTPIFAFKEATFTEDIGSLQYKSKEALYQYRDQKHVDEWLETISIIKNNAGNSQLVQDIVSYELLAQGLGEIVIEQQEAEAQELVKIGQLGGIINTFQENEKLIVQNIRSENESAARNTRLTLLTVILIAFIAATALGVYISRSITTSVGSVSQTAQAIAGGDLSKRVEVKSKDEIGQLATAFNEMADKLKESYEGLEEKVRMRTRELVGEKENATQEKDKIDAILHSIGDGVFVIDTNHRIIMLNRVATAISGFPPEEAVGQKYDHMLKFVYEKDEKINDVFIRDAMATGKITEMTNHTVLIRKDGKRVPVVDSAAPLKDKNGNVSGCVIVFRDVTKEREIDRAKSEFVSLASHQLRTPLSTISWYVEMFLAGDVGRVNKKQKKYLGKIYHNNRRMIELVNALLSASRIELGTFTMKPQSTDLREIADSVLDDLLPLIKNKGLKVEKQYEKNLPMINVDPQLMRIVFQNLFSNSVKYTPDSGAISITIERRESDVLMKVADTGYGIPSDQQSKIFTKLFRADNAMVIDPDGAGLGLYIVKSIVEKSGGKIWFESPSSFVSARGGSATGGKTTEDKPVHRSSGEQSEGRENPGTTFSVTIPLVGAQKQKREKGSA